LCFLYFVKGFMCFIFKGFYCFTCLLLYFFKGIIYVLLKILYHHHEMWFLIRILLVRCVGNPVLSVVRELVLDDVK
jgi:hypothetical protein